MFTQWPKNALKHYFEWSTLANVFKTLKIDLRHSGSRGPLQSVASLMTPDDDKINSQPSVDEFTIINCAMEKNHSTVSGMSTMKYISAFDWLCIDNHYLKNFNKIYQQR